ncbi:hypothetical protein [Prosthecobacter algae]|uniref:hypothetical protein n=1 Tax=Prosthecobacter algae TaxID=1144682 RepID=UPI0031EE0B9E
MSSRLHLLQSPTPWRAQLRAVAARASGWSGEGSHVRELPLAPKERDLPSPVALNSACPHASSKAPRPGGL